MLQAKSTHIKSNLFTNWKTELWQANSYTRSVRVSNTSTTLNLEYTFFIWSVLLEIEWEIFDEMEFWGPYNYWRESGNLKRFAEFILNMYRGRPIIFWKIKLLLNGPPIAYKNETATCHKAQVSTSKKFFADIILIRKVSRINTNQWCDDILKVSWSYLDIWLSYNFTQVFLASGIIQ